MGVLGLWNLIEDSATSVNIETLRGKTLAIGEWTEEIVLLTFLTPIAFFFRLVNMDQSIDQRFSRQGRPGGGEFARAWLVLSTVQVVAL